MTASLEELAVDGLAHPQRFVQWPVSIGAAAQGSLFARFAEGVQCRLQAKFTVNRLTFKRSAFFRPPLHQMTFSFVA